MKINLLQLGVPTTCTSVGMEGMLTHAHIDTDQHVQYLFQPRGTETETGMPHKLVRVTPGMLENPPQLIEHDLPLEVLGTPVTDTATAVTGMCVGLMVHQGGCCHAQIQPAGLNGKGKVQGPLDANILQCQSDLIPVKTADEKAADQLEKPSPSDIRMA